MRRSTLAWIAAITAAASGCNREPEPIGDAGGVNVASAPAAGAASSSDTRAAPALVDRALIDSCAGFDVDKAASLLGVSATELEVMEMFSDRIGGQICRYWSAESLAGPGIDFMLHAYESGDAAGRILATQRELMPRLDAVPATGPGLVEFDIGDEAFWDTNTGGVAARVRNVVVIVQASLSAEPTSHRDAEQIELERRIAEDVVSVLQR